MGLPVIYGMDVAINEKGVRRLRPRNAQRGEAHRDQKRERPENLHLIILAGPDAIVERRSCQPAPERFFVFTVLLVSRFFVSRYGCRFFVKKNQE
jgi:hypothetical protein